jgi:hypothetical protein
MTTIHDAPLTNYPRLIATLIRQRTLKIARRELQAQGVELEQVPSAYIRALAQAYVESHRAELIRVACDTFLTADRLRRLAQRRAQAHADRLAQPNSFNAGVARSEEDSAGKRPRQGTTDCRLLCARDHSPS